MKKTLIIAILASALIGFTPKVKAVTVNSKVVGADKSWTIYFNHQVLFDDLAKQGIVVTDNNGQKVNVTLKLGDDGKTVIVNPPDKGYEEGSSYNLIVDSKVHSKDNKNIKQQNITNFVVEKTANSEVVKFKDANLEKIIRKAANKPTGDLCKKDVEKIQYLAAGGSGIKSLAGIENLTNLYRLTLDENQISDITPLKNLTKLQVLDLDDNQISNIDSLKGLNNLTSLSLGNNKITNIESLSGLINLKGLDLSDNSIKDISTISKLNKLQSVYIAGNFFDNVNVLIQMKNLHEVDGDENLDTYLLTYNKASQIIGNIIKPEMSQLDKQKAVYDYVVNNIRQIGPDEGGSYGALVKGINSPSGCSKAVKLLLNMVGIRCILVNGTIGDEGERVNHMWNIVQIDGKYHHMDTTWFDPSVDENGNMNVYKYLNANDNTMKSDHKWDYSKYPKCE